MIDRLSAALFALGGLLAALLVVEMQSAEPTGHETAVRSQEPPVKPAVEQPHLPRPDGLVALILSRPLFNTTRRPADPSQESTTADPELSTARLTGIVLEPDRRIAIFAVPNGKPLVVSEGEMIDGWRVDAITPRNVSLSGPTGATTLVPKFDHGARPAPSAGARVSTSQPAGPASRMPIPPDNRAPRAKPRPSQ